MGQTEEQSQADKINIITPPTETAIVLPNEEQSNSNSPHNKHAIVSLINSDERSMNHYCFSLKSLHTNDILKPNSPILVFHEDDFPEIAKGFITKCTENPISFHL